MWFNYKPMSILEGSEKISLYNRRILQNPMAKFTHTRKPNNILGGLSPLPHLVLSTFLSLKEPLSKRTSL